MKKSGGLKTGWWKKEKWKGWEQDNERRKNWRVEKRIMKQKKNGRVKNGMMQEKKKVENGIIKEKKMEGLITGRWKRGKDGRMI